MSIIDLLDKYTNDKCQLNSTYKNKFFNIYNETIDDRLLKMRNLLINLSNNEIYRYKSFHTYINKQNNNNEDCIIKEMFYEKLETEYNNIKFIHKKINELLQVEDDTDIETIIKIIETLSIILDLKIDIIHFLMDICNIYKLQDKIHEMHKKLDKNTHDKSICNNKSISKSNFIYDICLYPCKLDFILSLP